ncbi:hypothetical protein [Vibrio phage vB_VpaS_CHI]|nr:hypothetical protein [Vibrio phage vB_VpaS_ALK]USL90146.1 hypothetical protein [Vibrio phage vB_VpaS_CHI]
MDDQRLAIYQSLLLTAFAALGGLLSYLLRVLNRDEKPRLYRAFVETFSSAFVGILAILACKALNIDVLWSGIIVGVFGWLGAEASIVILTGLVRKKLGVNLNADTKNS